MESKKIIGSIICILIILGLILSVFIPIWLIIIFPGNYMDITFEYQDSVNLGNDMLIEGLSWTVYQMDGTTVYASGTTDETGLVHLQMLSDSYIIKYDWFGVEQSLTITGDQLIELDPAQFIGHVYWDDTLEALPSGYEVDMLIYDGSSWVYLYTFTVGTMGMYAVDVPLGMISIFPANLTFTITQMTPSETEPVELYLESIGIIISIIIILNQIGIIYYLKLKTISIIRLKQMGGINLIIKSLFFWTVYRMALWIT